MTWVDGIGPPLEQLWEDYDSNSVQSSDVRALIREIYRMRAEGVRPPLASKYVTGTGQALRGVHPPSDCDGRPCVIHNPSDHPMRDFPTHWRSGGPFDVKPPHMERICPHGIGHPDPDDAAYLLEAFGEDVGVHGCDGCCAPNVE